MSNAPVAIFVYNRINHLQKMMDSLEENELVTQSDLYIFSDGGKDAKDYESVNYVRQWIGQYKKKTKFRNVYVTERNYNWGLANSIIDGVSYIFSQHDKVIVLEDDLLVTKYFLMYMNDALAYYEENKRIWSISGYTPPLKKLQNYEKNVYFNYRPYSWGWATWKDRWQLVDWQVRNYNKEKYNFNIQRRFMRGGNLMPSMLRAQMSGKIDSWYVRWAYEASKRNKITVYPVSSLVKNIGLDGSGIHCSTDMKSKYDNELNCSDTQYSFSVETFDIGLEKEFKAFHSLSIGKRIWKKITDR